MHLAYQCEKHEDAYDTPPIVILSKYQNLYKQYGNKTQGYALYRERYDSDDSCIEFQDINWGTNSVSFKVSRSDSWMVTNLRWNAFGNI